MYWVWRLLFVSSVWMLCVFFVSFIRVFSSFSLLYTMGSGHSRPVKETHSTPLLSWPSTGTHFRPLLRLYHATPIHPFTSCLQPPTATLLSPQHPHAPSCKPLAGPESPACAPRCPVSSDCVESPASVITLSAPATLKHFAIHACQGESQGYLCFILFDFCFIFMRCVLPARPVKEGCYGMFVLRGEGLLVTGQEGSIGRTEQDGNKKNGRAGQERTVSQEGREDSTGKHEKKKAYAIFRSRCR